MLRELNLDFVGDFKMDNFEYFKERFRKERLEISIAIRGLDATKVIIPAITHKEYVEHRRSYGQEWYDERDGLETVVDKEEVRAPDERKRESSKDLLHLKYDSSDWFTIRFMAGKGLAKTRVLKNVPHWANALNEVLKTTPFTSDIRAKYLIDTHELYKQTREDLLREILISEFNQTDIRKVKQEVGKYLGLGFWKRNFGKRVKAPTLH